jgi:hypothetical protein
MLDIPFVARIITVARENLTAAAGAALHIAHGTDMELALDHTAIVARMTVGSPVARLVTITDAGISTAADDVVRDALRGLDPSRPFRDHGNAVVDHPILRHGVLSAV